jgi:hypothetical protein
MKVAAAAKNAKAVPELTDPNKKLSFLSKAEGICGCLFEKRASIQFDACFFLVMCLRPHPAEPIFDSFFGPRRQPISAQLFRTNSPLKFLR